MAEGQSGGQQIARLEKGDSTRTAQHADVMNEIIDAANKFYSMTVTPQGAGKFIWADANGVLQLDVSGKISVEVGDLSELDQDVDSVEGVADVTKVVFDDDLFAIFDQGGGTCAVKLRTVECVCDTTEGIDGGDDG